MSNFRGYRVYNGCPDSELKARLDAESRALRNALRELKKIEPEARCVRFHEGGFGPGYFQCWVGNSPIGGWDPEKTFSSKIEAIEFAISSLKTKS